MENEEKLEKKRKLFHPQMKKETFGKTEKIVHLTVMDGKRMTIG